MWLCVRWFRGLCFLVVLSFIMMSFLHCASTVRDSDVYAAEIAFVEAAAAEQVERGIALINKSCKCESMMGQKGFTTIECRELAQTILVVKHRMNYHTAFMRYLGGISEERPPEDPPGVPEAFVLCPDDPEPIVDGSEIYGDAGVEDAGGVL